MTDNEIIESFKKFEPFFGSWYIRRFIGEGGFAKVFEIVRNDFGNEYTSALKIITISKTKNEIEAMRDEGMSEEDIRENLWGIVEDTVREIQLMYKLKGNLNIVGYEDHTVIEHENGPGWDILIKMEFLTSLGRYIRGQNGQIAKREVIKLGIDICKALEACQKYNIIHRDIKADNIFVSNNGDFKLGDFGIARIIERKDMELSKKGTFTYMAPEVYKGQTYTSAVDIYSLGMVMYRLLNNNRAPFLPAYPQSVSLDERDRALLLRMSGEKLPKPSQGDKGRLVEIVLKACAYRPEERYSSPVAMRQDLESILYEQDEITDEQMIIVYERSVENATFSNNQGSLSGTLSKDGTAGAVREENNVTEVLQEEDATEILQEEDDVTEILRRDSDASADFNSEGADIQHEPEKPTDRSGKQSKKTPVIAGICAAALFVAVITGIAVNRSSTKADTAIQGRTASADEPESTGTVEKEDTLMEQEDIAEQGESSGEETVGNAVPDAEEVIILLSKSITYGPDGSVSGWHEYEYGKSGNLLNDIIYNSDGSIWSWDEYDEFGNMLKCTYYEDGSVEYWHEYEYDETGNQLKDTVYDTDGSVDWWREYEYDETDNQLKKTVYDADGSVDKWYEYEYDETGNQLKETVYDADGSVVRWYGYEYDETGNQLKSITYDADGSVDWWREYEYDKSGHMLKSTDYWPSKGAGSYTEYEYDETGNQLRENWYYADGSVMRWTEYEYDETGNQLKETWHNADGSVRYWYEYEYITTSPK